jgi:hypothetical protein
MNRFVGFMSYCRRYFLTEDGLMKPTILRMAFFPVLFLISSWGATAQASDVASIKEQLIKLEKQSWEAWKNRDGKFFQDFLSDDHVEVGFGGVSNKAEIVSFVGSPVCTVKSYQLDQFELKMLDKNTALLTYREAQDTVCHNPVPSPCWVSSLYMKRGDRWLNVLYQQTEIHK